MLSGSTFAALSPTTDGHPTSRAILDLNSQADRLHAGKFPSGQLPSHDASMLHSSWQLCPRIGAMIAWWKLIWKMRSRSHIRRSETLIDEIFYTWTGDLATIWHSGAWLNSGSTPLTGANFFGYILSPFCRAESGEMPTRPLVEGENPTIMEFLRRESMTPLIPTGFLLVASFTWYLRFKIKNYYLSSDILFGLAGSHRDCITLLWFATT